MPCPLYGAVPPRVTSALAVLCLAAIPGLGAQQTAPAPAPAPVTVRGHVFSATDLTPVADAEFVLDGVPVGRSDSAGAFRFTASAGSHTLLIRRLGFAPVSAELVLAAGDDLEIGIQLEPRAFALDTVIVEGRAVARSPRLQEFYERMERYPTANFLTREDLDRFPERRLSDIFRTVRGVSVQCIDPYCTAYRLRPSGRVIGNIDAEAGPCDIQIYLDAVPFALGPSGIDEIDPDVVAGIEVYVGSSRVPVEFERRGARCGVVAIWTRDH